MKCTLLIILVLLIAAAVRPAAAQQHGPVLNLTVYGAGVTIGSVANPAPFTDLEVMVDESSTTLEVLAQLRLQDEERVAVISQADQLIITALTSKGVVGEPREGGYYLPTTQGEVAVVRLSGVIPEGCDEVMLIQIIGATGDSCRTLVTVTVTVTPPPGWLARLGDIAFPWGLVAIGAIVAVITAWTLARRTRQESLEE